jgi:hypothetical protein
MAATLPMTRTGNEADFSLEQSHCPLLLPPVSIAEVPVASKSVS